MRGGSIKKEGKRASKSVKGENKEEVCERGMYEKKNRVRVSEYECMRVSIDLTPLTNEIGSTLCKSEYNYHTHESII